MTAAPSPGVQVLDLRGEATGMGADCGGRCMRFVTAPDRYEERHDFEGGRGQKCETHTRCWVHSGVHYTFPVFNTVINDLGEPGLGDGAP